MQRTTIEVPSSTIMVLVEMGVALIGVVFRMHPAGPSDALHPDPSRAQHGRELSHDWSHCGPLLINSLSQQPSPFSAALSSAGFSLIWVWPP
jgi:hypothetical protein